jgi:hypothetical protein
MSWLAQIIMFLMLGLFATPSQFPAIAMVPAVLLGLFLMFVARPLAVWLCLIPFRYRAPRSPSSPGSACAARCRSCSPSPRCSAAWKTAGHLQHRLHHRAGIAGHPGLDGRSRWPSRLGLIVPPRLGAARQGRARIAGLGPSRTARLSRHKDSPVRAASASRAGRRPSLVCATAARCASRTWAGCRRRPRLHLRAGPLSAPARQAVRQPRRGRSRRCRFLRCLRLSTPRARRRTGRGLYGRA